MMSRMDERLQRQKFKQPNAERRTLRIHIVHNLQSPVRGNALHRCVHGLDDLLRC